MPVLARTRVDRNNRTTVPREVRRLLEVGNGDIIEWVYEEGRVYVRKASR
jgi:AbrB family looped-hinge helix DNA binding protein